MLFCYVINKETVCNYILSIEFTTCKLYVERVRSEKEKKLKKKKKLKINK